MRDCTCKLVVFKALLYRRIHAFFIVSASNSDRGRSDSPRAKDVVPLVSVQIIHVGNELTCTYASSAFLCRQFYRTRSTRTVMNWQRCCPHVCMRSDVSTTLKSKLLESVRGHLRHNKYTVPPEKKIRCVKFSKYRL